MFTGLSCGTGCYIWGTAMLKIDLTEIEELEPEKWTKHPKCLGETDYWGEFDCGYQTILICEDCKYGLGRKDPAAKCNQV